MSLKRIAVSCGKMAVMLRRKLLQVLRICNPLRTLISFQILLGMACLPQNNVDRKLMRFNVLISCIQQLLKKTFFIP